MPCGVLNCSCKVPQSAPKWRSERYLYDCDVEKFLGTLTKQQASFSKVVFVASPARATSSFIVFYPEA